jgi:hypothetical protein
MAIKAKVLLVESKYDHHDFKCFTVDSKYDADIIAYAVDSKYDAHELKVFLVDSKYDAQKKIFFVKSKYDL